MKQIKDVLDVILIDDKQAHGGISHQGETVADFIMDTNLTVNDSVDKLNLELKLCGINPIIVK